MEKKNRLILYFGCTFLFSWAVWFPALLHAWGVIELEHAGQTLVQIGGDTYCGDNNWVSETSFCERLTGL